MDPREYPQSNLPEVAEKRPDEQGFVENVEAARQQAAAVEKLVGGKIKSELNDLIAMKNFPGFEEEVAQKAAKIKELYEGAEMELAEGKRWTRVMKKAITEAKMSGFYAFSLSDFERPEEDFDDFVRYLEVKFGTPIQEYIGLNPNGSIRYLPIGGSNYLFKMEGGGIAMKLSLLADVGQSFIDRLSQWKQWTEEENAKQK